MLGKKEKSTANNSSEINVIGEGTKIIGDLSSDGDLRIDGEIEGNISTLSKCVLGTSAVIRGSIEAKSCDISGRVEGDVKVADLLLIKASGVVNGDIRTAKIVVENGGEFNGACTMGSSVSMQKDNSQGDVRAATA
ncbi:MAG: polymer-forming cytoskeletal protein [Bacteroidia bacterium]|nr:polymer-forming cytoskeletal protein [Bacteroidia bacterium]NNJ55879.1 polymer-forming cytoskeletal protein [Bacteroidia bacterium]